MGNAVAILPKISDKLTKTYQIKDTVSALQ